MNGRNDWFTNARVRYKILAGFAAVVVLMWVVAGIVFVQVARVDALNETAEDAVDNLITADGIDVATAERVATYRDYLLSGETDARAEYVTLGLSIQESLAGLRSRLEDPVQIAQIDTIAGRIAEWQAVTAEPGIDLRDRSLAPGGPSADSIIAFFQAFGRVDASRIRQAVDDFRDAQQDIVITSRAARDASIDQIRWVTAISAIIAAILSILLASRLADSIARKLQTAVDFAGTVAGGDFTRELEVEGRDEIGQLTKTLNRMGSDLREMVAGVTSSTSQVAAAAQQIAATSEEISATADRQVDSTDETSTSMEQIAAQIARIASSTESLAASVEQTSASVAELSASIEQTASSAESLGASVEQTSSTIEEMVVSITQVARHVEETQQISQTAETDARAGGSAVQSTIRGMQRIHVEMEDLAVTVKQLGRASESIGQITEVIEDIADQTNLLALNAAIEAARAGEHGRGFSVVAQEIRRLAERSVESTREIAATIRDVIDDMSNVEKSSAELAERTTEGINLADQAGTALEKIIDSAGRTRELMEEVSLATQQQIGAAEQAQEAIEQIQHVAMDVRLATREQAKSGRQIADAVENMNRRTKEVFTATAEQKKGGEMVLQAIEHINQGARGTQVAIQEMARAARDLSAQATRLTQLVSNFRV